MKELQTIHGEIMLIDDEDYEKAKQYRWKRPAGKQVITIIKNVKVSYKKLILGLGSKATLFKNENSLDLRKENIIVFETRSEYSRFMLDRHFKKKKKYYGTEEEAEQAYNNKNAAELYRSDIPFTKKIKTIQGKTILIDEKDYEKAIQYRWTIRTCNGRHSVLTFLLNKEKGRTIAFSYKELVLGIKSKLTLYKNDNPFDLRRENILIFNSRKECLKAIHEIYEVSEKFKNEEFKHSQSKKAQRSNTKTSKKTIYFGIDHDPKLQRSWLPSITHNKINYKLGSFLKDEHAALAYDQKALELFGTEAKRNFPDLTMEELTEKLDIIRADNELFSYEHKSKITQGKLRDIEKTSQYVGVCYCQQANLRKNWRAYITRYGKRYKLGHFYTEEEAAIAYDEKAIELYGEEATLNFPNITMEELSEKMAVIKVQNEAAIAAKAETATNIARSVQGKVIRKSKSSQYAGVTFNKRNKKWRAGICYLKKGYFLGNFDSEEAAARAYDKKALELYGENAKLNFPIK